MCPPTVDALKPVELGTHRLFRAPSLPPGVTWPQFPRSEEVPFGRKTLLTSHYVAVVFARTLDVFCWLPICM